MAEGRQFVTLFQADTITVRLRKLNRLLGVVKQSEYQLRRDKCPQWMILRCVKAQLDIEYTIGEVEHGNI